MWSLICYPAHWSLIIRRSVGSGFQRMAYHLIVMFLATVADLGLLSPWERHSILVCWCRDAPYPAKFSLPLGLALDVRISAASHGLVLIVIPMYLRSNSRSPHSSIDYHFQFPVIRCSLQWSKTMLWGNWIICDNLWFREQSLYSRMTGVR